jgi:hypothetical protein
VKETRSETRLVQRLLDDVRKELVDGEQMVSERF